MTTKLKLYEENNYFAQQAAEYAKIRPSYPKKLFKYLAEQSPDYKLAWDVATGNGQAAISLSLYFDNVIGTDISKKQLQYAHQVNNIYYSHSSAERSHLKPNTIDCIVVAQAIHWLDIPKFYEEIKRVSKRGAIIAIINYRYVEISDEIDNIINKNLIEGLLSDYWTETNKTLSTTNLNTLDFPFEEIRSPDFSIELKWTLQNFCDYLNSLSAAKEYILQNRCSVLNCIEEELSHAWGDITLERKIKFPLMLKLGRL